MQNTFRSFIIKAGAYFKISAADFMDSRFVGFILKRKYITIFAQQGVTQCGVPTGQPKFPLLTYQELPDPTAPSDKELSLIHI